MRTGKEQLQEPHSQGPGLTAVCLLNHFSIKLQNDSVRWAEGMQLVGTEVYYFSDLISLIISSEGTAKTKVLVAH